MRLWLEEKNITKVTDGIVYRYDPADGSVVDSLDAGVIHG